MEMSDFIRQFASISNRNINEIKEFSSLENDLGITGDEAEEIIIKISNIFHVNISEFKFEQYFYDEYSVIRSPVHSIKEFTVRNLYNGVTTGKLE